LLLLLQVLVLEPVSVVLKLVCAFFRCQLIYLAGTAKVLTDIAESHSWCGFRWPIIPIAGVGAIGEAAKFAQRLLHYGGIL
jgi:hypothetical protein